MPLVTRTSPAAQTAVGYITAGSLILVWSGVWMAWLMYVPSESVTSYFLCVGTMLSGLAILVIGLLLGQIGRAAKPAEQPAEVAAQTSHDANGNVIATPPPAVPTVAAPVAQPPAYDPNAVARPPARSF